MTIEDAQKTLSQHFNKTVDDMHFDEWNITTYQDGFIFTTKARSNGMYLVRGTKAASFAASDGNLEDEYAKLA